MNNRQKIWLGVGVYLLTNVNPVTAITVPKSQENIPGIVTDQSVDNLPNLVNLSNSEIKNLINLSSRGGEGGEGGERGERGEGGESS